MWLTSSLEAPVAALQTLNAEGAQARVTPYRPPFQSATSKPCTLELLCDRVEEHRFANALPANGDHEHGAAILLMVGVLGHRIRPLFRGVGW